MTALSRRHQRRLPAGAAAAAALILGVTALALPLGSAASVQTAPSCADTVSSAPTRPATVSTASTSFGKVLVVGSGDYAGCSLYLLTSDQLRALTGVHFACSDDPNAIGQPCDTFLWPALLTKGAPIAGPGVNPKLLGTVTRDDLPGLPAVQQVTYGGMPLYRFFLDETPGETSGADLFDPVTSPTGIWYLVHPSTGLPAPGQPQMRLETAPVSGIGPDETVLAVSMNDSFSLFADGSFPVYTLSKDRGHTSACEGLCALSWPPVLTTGRPGACLLYTSPSPRD